MCHPAEGNIQALDHTLLMFSSFSTHSTVWTGVEFRDRLNIQQGCHSACYDVAVNAGLYRKTNGSDRAIQYWWAFNLCESDLQ